MEHALYFHRFHAVLEPAGEFGSGADVVQLFQHFDVLAVDS